MKTKFGRAILFALVVGGILNIINQWDHIIYLSFDSQTLVKMTLTPLVPFFVSLLSSAIAEKHNSIKPVERVFAQIADKNLDPRFSSSQNVLIQKVFASIGFHLKELRGQFLRFFNLSYTLATIDSNIGKRSNELLHRTKGLLEETDLIRERIDSCVANENQVVEKARAIKADSEEVSSLASENLITSRQATDALMKMVELVEHQVKCCKDISEFSKAIDDLSFQSKILSFNASVEAARAGEAGRGFSVVASEINRLSDNAKQKTLEIREKTNRLTESITELVQLSDKSVEWTSLNNEQNHQICEIVQNQARSIADISLSADTSLSHILEIKEYSTNFEASLGENLQLANTLEGDSRKLHLNASELRESVNKYQGVIVSRPKNVFQYIEGNLLPIVKALVAQRGISCQFDVSASSNKEIKPKDVYALLCTLQLELGALSSIEQVATIDGLEILPNDVMTLGAAIYENLQHHLVVSSAAESNQVDGLEEWKSSIGPREIEPRDVYILVTHLNQWLAAANQSEPSAKAS